MAPRKCCVPTCTVQQGAGVAMHRFPNPSKPEEIDRFRTWIMKIGGDIVGEDDLFIHKNRRICHRHFEGVYTFPNNRLTSLAIPTLHIPGSSQKQEGGQSEQNRLLEQDRLVNRDCHAEEDSHSQVQLKLQFEEDSFVKQASHVGQDSYGEQDSHFKQNSEFKQVDIPVEENEETFSWQKINEIAPVEDPPVVDLEVDASGVADVLEAAPQRDEATDTDSLRCCECGRHIPQDSVRCVCVSCPEGHICTSCESSDAHCHHYVLRAPRNATQSEVREVLQRVRLVLLDDFTHNYPLIVPIKLEVKNEEEMCLDSEQVVEDDPLCGYMEYDRCSEVPNVDEQKTSKPETDAGDKVLIDSCTRKRRRSESQSKHVVPIEMSKEPAEVLNPLQNMMRRALPEASKLEQRIKISPVVANKAKDELMKRALGKHDLRQMLNLKVFSAPQKKDQNSSSGIAQKKELNLNLGIAQQKEPNSSFCIVQKEPHLNLDIAQKKEQYFNLGLAQKQLDTVRLKDDELKRTSLPFKRTDCAVSVKTWPQKVKPSTSSENT